MTFATLALSWLKACISYDRSNLFTCARIFQLGFIVLLISIVSLSLGCGGGTSGTGVKEFEGSLTTLGGDPVVGARITLVESGTTVTTDSQGKFALSGDLPEGQVALQVETNGVTNTVTISQLPRGEAAVNVELQLNQQTSSVTATNVIITPSGSPPSNPRPGSSGNTGIPGTPQDPGITVGSLPPDGGVSSGNPGSPGISGTPGNPITPGGSITPEGGNTGIPANPQDPGSTGISGTPGGPITPGGSITK